MHHGLISGLLGLFSAATIQAQTPPAPAPKAAPPPAPERSFTVPKRSAKSLTLKELFGLLEESNSVQIANSRVRESQASLTYAYDGLWPDLDYTFGTGWGDDQMLGYYATAIGGDEFLSHRLTLNWTLFDGNRTLQAIHIADRRKTIAEIEKTATLKAQRRRLAELYYEAALRRYKVEVLDRDLADFQQLLRMTRGLFEKGAQNRSTVLSAEVAFIQKQQEILAGYTDYQRQKTEIAKMVRRDPDTLEIPDIENIALGRIPRRETGLLQTRAKETSSDIKSLRVQRELKDHERWASYSDSIPKLRFVARHQSPTIGGLIGSDSRSSVGLFLEIPLPLDVFVNLPALNRKIEEQQLQLAAAERQTSEEIDLEIALRQRAIENSRGILDNIRDFARKIEDERRAAGRSFRVGTLSLTEYLTIHRYCQNNLYELQRAKKELLANTAVLDELEQGASAL